MHKSFTQTKEYVKWHEAVGEKVFWLEESQVAALIVKLKIGKVLYLPYGGLTPNPSPKERGEVQKQLIKIARENDCVFVRMEGGRVFANDGVWQPRMEWWLDTRPDEEELLARIHKDHKYSIRRAQKESIEVEIVHENLEDYFDIFLNLMKETSARDGFKLYDEKYYQQIFDENNNELTKFLVLTKLDDIYLSVALIVMYDRVAHLVFAGSVSGKRELGFNNLMQWEAIKEVKNLGCEIYNFGGITENLNGKTYGKKSLQGVTNFKKKFGGYAKFHGDFLDIPLKKFKYLMYFARKFIQRML